MLPARRRAQRATTVSDQEGTAISQHSIPAKQQGNWNQPQTTSNQTDCHNIEYGYDVSSLFKFKADENASNTQITQHSTVTRQNHAGGSSHSGSSTLSQAGSSSIQPKRPREPVQGAWRHFKSDTRAGRLLRQLYEVNDQAPKVNYPKLNVKKRTGVEKRPRWFMGANHPDHTDPRSKSDRKERVELYQVPKPVTSKIQVKPRAAIELIQPRRPKHVIEREISEIEVSREEYRPMPRKAVSTESEKRKLLAYFQFKGGKSLPECGTLRPMEGQLPLSLVTGKPDAALLKRNRIRNAAKMKEAAMAERAERKAELQKQFDIVSTEVERHKKQLAQVVDSNTHNRVIVKLQEEIQKCIAEMRDLDELITECG